MFFVLLLSAGYFIFCPKTSFGLASPVTINKILFNPDGNDEGAEWIELYNNSEADIDLSGWDLDPDTGSYQKLKGKIIGKDRLIINGLSGLRNAKGQVSLYNSSGHNAITLVDYVQYGSADLGTTENKIKDRAISAGIWPAESYFAINPDAKLIERISDGADSDSPDDWQESPVNKPEANENKKSNPPPSSPRTYFNAIKLNEILPNASGEYIELYNTGNQNENLSGWTLRDASKSGKYVFPENSTVAPLGYFTAYGKKNFKFALNNSGGETVRLFSPDEHEVDSVSYVGSRKNFSYSFDGAAWRWSSFLTPGEKNKLEAKPKIEIVQLSPNPQGRDSENEWIKIKNKSKKKINLQNWSVATGWKKILNHPITEKTIIAPGKIKTLTRKHSKFVLGNKKSRVEIRYPDGQVAAKAKYKNQTSIKEDVVYAKENKKWQWIDSSENKNKNNTTVAAKQPEKNKLIATSNATAPKKVAVKSNSPDTTPEPIKNIKNKYVLANYHATISPKNTPASSAATAPKPIPDKNNIYTFTKKPTPSQHYMIKFLGSTKKEAAYRLGRFFY